MRVRLLEAHDDLTPAIELLLQLRPQYDAQGLRTQIEGQRSGHGYQLALVSDDEGRPLSVAGFVIEQKLAWGKSLYVDDLVTAAAVRSTGAGKCLLDWLKTHAIAQGCTQLHLDSGVQRFDAHRFYLRAGFRIASHHFSMDLSAAP